MLSVVYCDLWCYRCGQQKDCKKAKIFEKEFKSVLKKQEMPKKEKG
ncbi:MAG TPA: hypothetical protein VJB11_03315 [archaeon]|nr:hypothetical protein [archaeon]